MSEEEVLELLKFYIDKKDSLRFISILQRYPHLVNSPIKRRNNTLLTYAVGWQDYYWNRCEQMRLWNIITCLIEYGGQLSPGYRSSTEVVNYMLLVNRRRIRCAASIRVLLGLRRFKKASVFENVNKDVMQMIAKKLFCEAGRREEWGE